MFGIIWAIIVGFVVGLIARAIHPGEDKAGFWVTSGLGIVGAFLATFGGRALGWYGPTQAAGFIASVVGAIIVLFLYNLIVRGK